MATLTVNKLALTGAATALVSAAAGGDKFANPRGTAWIEVNNGSGSSINVTAAAAVTNRPADGTFPAATQGDLVVAVAAGVRKRIGPFPPAYVDASGFVNLTYSAVTTVTIEACDLP